MPAVISWNYFSEQTRNCIPLHLFENAAKPLHFAIDELLFNILFVIKYRLFTLSLMPLGDLAKIQM